MICCIYGFLEKIYGKKIFLIFYRMAKIWINLFYPLYVAIFPAFVKENRKDVVISLTSFPARINKVHLTLESLLRQTIKPGEIILYLSKEQFSDIDALPKKLKYMAQSHKIKIEFCDGDLKSHKKYYYAMKDRSDKTIITVDDDIVYPEDLIECLLKCSEKFPDTVCCTVAHRMKINGNSIGPYNSWEKNCQIIEKPKMDLLAVGCGGVLYPPHTFDLKRLLDKESISTLCPYADDLWLKSNEVLNEKKTVKIGKYTKFVFVGIVIWKNQTLTKKNVIDNGNDRQMQKILERNPTVLEKVKM